MTPAAEPIMDPNKNPKLVDLGEEGLQMLFIKSKLAQEADKAKTIYGELRDGMTPVQIARILADNCKISADNFNDYQTLIKQIFFKL